jgi:hypothetical protein
MFKGTKARGTSENMRLSMLAKRGRSNTISIAIYGPLAKLLAFDNKASVMTDTPFPHVHTVEVSSVLEYLVRRHLDAL